MTTIKDVAKHARVSVTAVSYALNDTGTISDDTRKRILAVAKELNYHPNAFARNLKKRKTGTVGVFITSFGGSFYEEILEGIHDAVIQTDYEMIVCPESWTKRKVLTHRQVDGAIVFDYKIDSETIVNLASKKFPIVILDRNLESEYLFPLLLDNEQGVKETFYHFYNQGAQRIFFVSGASDSFDNAERKKAFLHEAEKNSVPIICFEGNFTEQSGYDVAKKIIQANDLPDAVFCANDQMAIGFIKAMKAHGLKAPDDIGVVGFDDIKIAQYIQPGLSSVSSSRFSWGAAAANQLIELLENDNPFPKPYRIETQLIQRESSVKNYGRDE
jgi:LacI family transcriptional regulator